MRPRTRVGATSRKLTRRWQHPLGLVPPGERPGALSSRKSGTYLLARVDSYPDSDLSGVFGGPIAGGTAGRCYKGE